nr:hypothetical protein [Tanacetum cinerariifolium]
IWEEFTQSIHTFIDDKRNLAHHTSGKKKATLIVIPSIRFTKLIIYHLQRKHKFHQRPDSSLHLPIKSLFLDISSSVLREQREESLGCVFLHSEVYRESVAEDVPAKEPQVDTEEADMQRALEEGLKSMYDVTRGPLPPVVIREPESRKYQPLPEVPRKGKEKVIEEQVARDLLNLQTSKKKSPTDQYIFQRHTSTPTGSSGHDESLSLYAELRLSDSKEESEEVVPGADAGGTTSSDSSLLFDSLSSAYKDKDSSCPEDPVDPGNAEESQPMPSPVVHAGSDHEHMDLDVQENLKLTVEEQVLLEEPACSSGTLSSLQHLTKDLSFGDLFFSDKPSEADNDKATVETKAESMVSVTIQQDMSSIPPMTTLTIDLTSRPKSPKVHQQLKATATETTKTTTTTLLPSPYQQQQSTAEAMMMKRIGELKHIMANLIQKNKTLEQRLDSHEARLYTLEQLDIPHQVSKAVNKVVTDAVDWAMQAPLRNRFRDLPEANMKEILHQRMWETDSNKSHKDHMQLYEALEKLMNRDNSEELKKDLSEARKKKKRVTSHQKCHLGPHLINHILLHQQVHLKLQDLLELLDPPKYHHHYLHLHPPIKKTDIRLMQSISLTPADLQMDEDMAPNKQAQSSDDKDIGSAHIPKVNLWQDWWKPLEKERPATPELAWSILSSNVLVLTNNWASALASNYAPPPEDSLLAQTDDIAMFMDWFCKRRGITELKPQDLEGPAFEIVKDFHPNVIHLQYQMEEFHKLLTDNVDASILRHNVSKPLPLGGPPGHIWIEEECKYDIAAIAVKTHIRILSVVIIEVFSMYGYDYMKKIVLRRADLNEHVIAERDFKYPYPSDFEDLYLLNLQGHLNQLPPKDKKILTTTVNQWTRHLVIRQ